MNDALLDVLSWSFDNAEGIELSEDRVGDLVILAGLPSRLFRLSGCGIVDDDAAAMLTLPRPIWPVCAGDRTGLLPDGRAAPPAARA